MSSDNTTGDEEYKEDEIEKPTDHTLEEATARMTTLMVVPLNKFTYVGDA